MVKLDLKLFLCSLIWIFFLGILLNNHYKIPLVSECLLGACAFILYEIYSNTIFNTYLKLKLYFYRVFDRREAFLRDKYIFTANLRKELYSSNLSQWILTWDYNHIERLNFNRYQYECINPAHTILLMQKVFPHNLDLAYIIFCSHYPYHLLNSEDFFQEESEHATEAMVRDIKWREILFNYENYAKKIEIDNKANGIIDIKSYHKSIYPTCFEKECHNYLIYESMFFTEEESKIIKSKLDSFGINKHSFKKWIRKNSGDYYSQICYKLLEKNYDFSWSRLDSFKDIYMMMNKREYHISFPFVLEKNNFKYINNIENHKWSFEILSNEEDFLIWSCSLDNCLDTYYIDTMIMVDGKMMFFLEAMKQGLIATVGIYKNKNKYAVMVLDIDKSIREIKLYKNKEIEQQELEELLELIAV